MIAAAPTKVPAPKLLAVLPFDALSSDRELGCFADGLADEILEMLTQVTEIRVIGRASSFRLREALDASHLLDASVGQSGSMLRIGVQLIEIASRVTLWSHSVDRSTGNAPTLQSEIADNVARALRCKLGLKPEGAVDTVLHEKIRQAFYVRRMARTAWPIPRRSTNWLCRRRIARLPDCPIARASAAEAKHYRRQRPEISETQAARLWEEQRVCVARALAIDPGCVDALVAQPGLQPPCGAFCAREAIPPRGWQRLAAAALHRIGAASRAQQRGAGPCQDLPRARAPGGPVRGPGASTNRKYWSRTIFADIHQAREAAAAQQAALFGCWPMLARLTEPARLQAIPTRGPLAAKALGLAEACRCPTDAQRDAALRGLEDSPRSRGYPAFLELSGACVFDDLDPIWDIIERADFEPLLKYGGRFGLAPHNSTALLLTFAAKLRDDLRFVRLCARLAMVRHWIETDRWPDCGEQTSYDVRAEVACVA